MRDVYKQTLAREQESYYERRTRRMQQMAQLELEQARDDANLQKIVEVCVAHSVDSVIPEPRQPNPAEVVNDL
jgi:hypothetical protein